MVDRASRQRDGAALAETLVALTPGEALIRIAEAGFNGEVVKLSGWVTGDQAFNRVRLWVDVAGRIVRATAG